MRGYVGEDAMLQPIEQQDGIRDVQSGSARSVRRRPLRARPYWARVCVFKYCLARWGSR